MVWMWWRLCIVGWSGWLDGSGQEPSGGHWLGRKWQGKVARSFCWISSDLFDDLEIRQLLLGTFQIAVIKAQPLKCQLDQRKAAQLQAAEVPLRPQINFEEFLEGSLRLNGAAKPLGWRVLKCFWLRSVGRNLSSLVLLVECSFPFDRLLKDFQNVQKGSKKAFKATENKQRSL